MFDPEFIMPDSFFSDYQPIDIAEFLIKIGSALVYEVHTYQSKDYSTGQAIKFALTEPFPHKDGKQIVKPPYCSIPYMLCMLEKEQGLLRIGAIKKQTLKLIPTTMKLYEAIEAKNYKVITTVWQKRLDYCLGYGCRDKETREDYPAWSASARGFVNQLRRCARRSKELFMQWKLGRQLSCQPFDKVYEGYPTKTIVPKNAFTYMFYEYNPRIEGARNFVAIKEKYFESN